MNVRALLLVLCTALLYGPCLAAGLTVGNYTVVSSKRISVTVFEYVYRAEVTNTGPSLKNVTGVINTTDAATTVVEGTLSFGDVGAGASAPSIDTITLRRDRSVPFDASSIVWSLGGTPSAAIQSDFVFNPQGGAAPITIRFTPTPVTDAAINRFEWDFNGDGLFDRTDTVGRDQTWNYTVPGTYAVSLRITDSQNRTDTRTKDVVIGNNPPNVTASASPTNGQVPLTVNFFASASDSDGVTRFEWDFDGDGMYDRTINASSGNTSFAYTSVGTFQPRVRATDTRGASAVAAVPAMEVRAAPVGSPQATLSLSRTSGPAPLAVTLSASVSDPQGAAVQSYAWDPDGNGTFDGTTSTNSFAYTYGMGGTYYPRVRITMADGRTADDVKTVAVTSTVNLALDTDTLDAQLAQIVTTTMTLSATTRVSLVVETREGTAVRTMLPPTQRAAGSHVDTWDGKNDGGVYVPEGIYKIVLVYELNGTPQRFDLSTTTGGQEYNPPRTSIPSTFEPYNNRPLAIDFTLSRASEVTAFMGSFNVDTRYVTFYTRHPFGRGTYRITWNGENADGQIIKPAPGDSFLFGIFGYTLPNNGVFVRNGVQLSAMTSSPPIFDPTGLTADAQPIRCTVQFTLSRPATAELTVQDTITGAVVQRLQFPGLGGGAHNVQWDGRTADGRYAAPGTYRLGLTAIQSDGFQSLSTYVLQRIYY